MKPIGYFRCGKKSKVDAARQSAVEASKEVGVIEFLPNQNFEQALEDLEAFSHIWLIYQFHKNSTWKPKVLPPRGSKTKVGVFASRSPYRPNPIGMSPVKLLRVSGRKLFVEQFDLLDGTPILDVKPYLPYSDAIADANHGWLGNHADNDEYEVLFTEKFSSSAEPFLDMNEFLQFKDVINSQLGNDPLNKQKKRVKPLGGSAPSTHEFAYKLWRVGFSVDHDKKDVHIHSVRKNH